MNIEPICSFHHIILPFFLFRSLAANKFMGIEPILWGFKFRTRDICLNTYPTPCAICMRLQLCTMLMQQKHKPCPNCLYFILLCTIILRFVCSLELFQQEWKNKFPDLKSTLSRTTFGLFCVCFFLIRDATGSIDAIKTIRSVFLSV